MSSSGRPLKILLVHNHYAQRGGEDSVYAQERDLLRRHGHEVIEYTKDNRDVGQRGMPRMALDAIWSGSSARDVSGLIRRHSPDVMHVHNMLPQISPSVVHSAVRMGVPVVHTLHNYRLVCANGLMLRDGQACEDCLGKALPVPALVHRCYRASAAATAVVVASTGFHRMIGTWSRHITRYIALCEFAKQKLLAAGLPEERVSIKPNFVIDRHASATGASERAGALFVGRLSIEKGVDTLVRAWSQTAEPLEVIGSGEMDAQVKAIATPNVSFRGFADQSTIAAAMRRALFVAMPSRFYEGFPVVLAEAYSAGVPVIASRLGALQELVRDGETGLHFAAGDAGDLANKARWAFENPDRMAEMGRAARRLYESLYSPESNYRQLVGIYDEARRDFALSQSARRVLTGS